VSNPIDFLRARLDEDEAAARAAADTGDGRWTRDDPPWSTPGRINDGSRDRVIVYNEGAPDADEAAHIARHDPARVLAEVEAKRRVLARHRIEPGRWGHACVGCGTAGDPADPVTEDINDCPELRDMATVYADHPDYLPEWAPTA
jgi:hypothetical protein